MSRQNRIAPDRGKYSPPGSAVITRSAIAVIRARDQHIAAALQQFFRDADHMLRRLARRENHFRNAMPQSPMVIDLGKADIFERHVAEAIERRIDI